MDIQQAYMGPHGLMQQVGDVNKDNVIEFLRDHAFDGLPLPNMVGDNLYDTGTTLCWYEHRNGGLVCRITVTAGGKRAGIYVVLEDGCFLELPLNRDNLRAIFSGEAQKIYDSREHRDTCTMPGCMCKYEGVIV